MDLFDGERQFLNDVVYELDGGPLIVSLVEPQHSKPRTVVDSGVLVVALFTRQGRHEFHVNMDLQARQGLLVTLPALEGL